MKYTYHLNLQYFENQSAVKQLKSCGAYFYDTFFSPGPLNVKCSFSSSSRKQIVKLMLYTGQGVYTTLKQQQESFKYLPTYLSWGLFELQTMVLFPDIEAKFIFSDMNLPNLIWPHYLRSIERITNGLGALLLQAVTWACQIN